MNLFKNKILRSRKGKLTLVLSFALFFVLIPKYAFADITLGGIVPGVITTVFGGIFSALNSICGVLMGLVMRGLISFSSYNNFIHEGAIKEAWKIVSSFCNMFFILIVLVIAFANILNIDSYRIKSTLPKVIIMAILINFSLMICGLLIDFSQIFMMTFVNAIGKSGGSYVDILKIKDFFDEVKNAAWEGKVNAFSAVIGMAMSFIFMAVATIVLFYILMIIIMRIAMLWIYSVLSPFAFVLSAFPAGKPYAAKWWDRFTKELIAGPVLMFFVWLAFYLMQTTNFAALTDDSACTGPLKLFCPGSFLSFFMAIAMLIGGLKITQEIGGVTGGLAGSAMNRVQQGRGLIQKGAKNFGGFLVDKASEGVKMDLNPFRTFRRMSAEMSGNKAERENIIYNKTLDTIENKGSFRGALAHISTGDLAWRSFTNLHKNNFAGLKRFNMGGTAFKKEADKRSSEKEELEKQREKVLSFDEELKVNNKSRSLKTERKNILSQINEQKWEEKTLPAGKEREAARKKLEDLNEERKQIKEAIKFHEEKYADKRVSNKEATRLDEDIKTAGDRVKDWNKYQVSGMASARAQSMAELQSGGNKLIANIDGSERLSQMYSEALANKMPGLASAIVLKMAKNGDYNELQSHLGLGTGLEGLKGLGKSLEKSGLSRQSALGVLADLGSITKNIGHFGGFGSVVMKNGKLDYANDKQYESAKLAEMMKMQPQQFARSVNRLGLGYYKGGNHTMDNWKISPAALAYLKLNNEAVGDNYKKTGQQNALEHLASAINDLRAAGIEEKSELMKNIDFRTNRAKGSGADVELMIDQINRGLKKGNTKNNS